MLIKTKIMLALLGAGLLVGCGSDNDDDDTGGTNPPPPAATYELSGTVTGLDGSLTLAAGDEEQTVTADGTVTFETEFETGDQVTVSITAEPDLQSCEITSAATFTFASADISSLAVTCTDLALYTAVDDTAESTGGEVSIDVLANDTSEYATAFTLVSVTDPANGTAVISDTTITYTPDDGFAGTDTFMYTGTDGAQEDTATVTVTVTQTVTVSGRVTDSPIANATITLTFNGQTYTATADAEGNYQLVIPISNSANTERPRLTAQGADTQSYVVLSSRLPSASSMLAAAGDDGILVRAEANQVQVTQLTTAENLQLETLAQGEPISEDNIQALLTEFDSELMLEMAAAIKLLVDNPNYQLPEGYETIEEFIADETAYNAMVEQAEASGELEQALQETINDPEVAGPPPGVGLSDYYGTYIINNLGSRFTGRATISAVVISEDGIYFTTTRGENNFQPEPLIEQEDGSWLAETVRSFDYFLNFFTVVYSYNVQMDLATQTALEGYLMNTQGTFTLEFYNDRVKVISSSENAVIVERSSQVRFMEYNFTYEGVDYTIPTQELESSSGLNTWLPYDSLKSGAMFEVVDGSKWIVPQIFDYNVDIKPEYDWGVDFQLESQLITMSAASAGATSGTYVNDLTGATGTWALLESGKALQLTTPIVDGDGVVTIHYARKDEHAHELLSTVQFADGEVTRSLSLLDRGGMLDSGLPTSTLVHGEGEMNLALVNMAADDWDENGPILFGELGWQYGWHLAADQSLQFVQAYCDSPTYLETFWCDPEFVYWNQGNAQEGDSWIEFDSYVHLVRPSRFSSPDCTGAIACGGRFVSPVKVNSTTGIITILEMELVGNDSPWDFGALADGLNEGGIYQWIAPRINYWYTIPYAGVGPGNGPGQTAFGASTLLDAQGLASPLSKYQKVLPWQSNRQQQN